MTFDVPNQSEFSRLVRMSFAYLELPQSRPRNQPLMDSFFERIPSPTYPWYRGCGYWNIHASFGISWDLRDEVFNLDLRPNGDIWPNEGRSRPCAPIEWILDALHPGWQHDWPDADKNDGVQLVQLYAKAIEPFAAEVFVPAVRPSKGLEGFSWYSRVAPRMGGRL